MSAADVGDPAAGGEPVGHSGQGRDPLGGEAGGVAGAKEPLGALEDSRVLLVPGDAGAGAERLGETVDAREPAASDGGAAEIGGTTYHALYNDFGPSSIDGWLTDLAAREMLIDNDALLDPDRRQLILDGTRADLTKLEFDVLQYLHEREGRVVGRAALLRDVWGYDWSGGSNVVEVVISALRRKLGDSAGSLQTVRGAGYRFTAPP